jgi:hypothetical protein
MASAAHNYALTEYDAIGGLSQARSQEESYPKPPVTRQAVQFGETPALPLPVKLRADLPNSRIAGVGDDSEVRAGDVPARIRKLRVVEYVEEFDAQVKRKILSDLGLLQEPKIGVVESGAVEEAPVGGAKCS